MGGYISFEIMRHAPERVLKLALLDTTARPDMPVQTALRREQLEKVRTGDAMAMFAEALRQLMLPAHRDDAQIAAVNARMAATVGVDGFTRQTEAIIGRVDSRPGLGSIAVPTLVLVGDGDAVTPLDRAEEMAGAIPNAKLVVVTECGHLATLEQPAAVNRALVEWIGG
jgi:pimeloyl-ACP methyl ester carboxylesterase